MWRFRLDKRSFAQASLLFLLLVGIFLPAFVLYDRIDGTVRKQRADFVASQVANRFQQMVESRLGALGILEYVIPSLNVSTYEQFEPWSERIEREVRGFQALNWVNPTGVIEWVFPEGPNRPALGRNLFERPELVLYLVGSRDSGKPMLSHIVTLFQGPRGVVLYVPVYGDGKQFLGWVNGVFTVDELVGGLLLGEESGGYDFRMDFLDHAGSSFERGYVDPEREQNGSATVEVLNQRVRVTTRVHPGSAALRELDWLQRLIVFGVTASLFVISVFAYQLLLSRRRLAERLEKEHFQSVLLNLLVHDIVNPLLIVRFSTDAALRVVPPEARTQLEKIVYAVDQLSSVLTRVKDMRAVELGKMRLEVAPAEVEALFADVRTTFEPRCRDKRVTLRVAPAPPGQRILVDRVTFLNNVLNNLVSNAIKFTDPDTVVTVRSEDLGSEVMIEVCDQGMGMSEETTRHVFLENYDVTKPGTLGERGTGIGMLQVRSYTRIFGGRVTVESKQRKPGVPDHGTKVRLYLQKA